MQILENPPYTDVFEEVFRIRHRFLKLFTNEKIEELKAEIADIPETDCSLSALKKYWKLIFAAEERNIKEVEELLREGLSQSIWFSKTVLGDFLREAVDSPLLEPLIVQHEKMYLEVKEDSEAQLIVRTPKRYRAGKRYPLILFLDGRYSDHRISEFYWKPGLEMTDVIFASLRSSQRPGFGQYVWDNENTSLQEVRDAYEILRQRSDVDETKVIVSGMSQGTKIALQSIANDIIPAKGFITIAQALKPDQFFGAKSQTLVGKDLRGVIVSGEKDIPRCTSHKKFHELAVSSGIDCMFISYPDIGHEYPDDFDRVVQQSLSFILE